MNNEHGCKERVPFNLANKALFFINDASPGSSVIRGRNEGMNSFIFFEAVRVAWNSIKS